MAAKQLVIGYLRVSTREQADEGVSLDAQKATLASYAETYGLEILRFEIDKGKSAGNLKRAGIQAALASLEAGEATGLLITKMDRLSRSMSDWFTTLSPIFKRFDIALMSVGDYIDSSTANGRMMLHMVMMVAEWERDKISERTMEALDHLKSQGVKLGRTGYGQSHVPREEGQEGRLQIVGVAAEQLVIKEIKRLRYEMRWPMRAIADYLNDQGISVKRGGMWHASTISNILAAGPVRWPTVTGGK